MDFGIPQTIKWLGKTNNKIQENKQYLTELDQKIGDGDHGINMARGFNLVIEKITESEYGTVGAIFKDIAMTVISKVGGASGPLYGTAFLRMSAVFSTKESLDYATFVEGLEAGLTGIKERGKAIAGEKTIIDVWEPVVNQMKQSETYDAEAIETTAKSAVEKTKDIMGTKGRAAYFKEASIGHIDPGSMSSYYLFASLAEVVEDEL